MNFIKKPARSWVKCTVSCNQRGFEPLVNLLSKLASGWQGSVPYNIHQKRKTKGATTWLTGDVHSEVQFRVKRLMASTVMRLFSRFIGKLEMNWQVAASTQIASVAAELECEAERTNRCLFRPARCRTHPQADCYFDCYWCYYNNSYHLAFTKQNDYNKRRW